MANYEKEELRYLFVRYEELILQPEIVLNNVCSFLHIDYEIEMLNYQAKRKFTEKGNQFNQLHHMLNEPLSKERINRSFHELPDEDLIFLNAYLSNELTKLGYELPQVKTGQKQDDKSRLLKANVKYFFKLDLLKGYLIKKKFQLHVYGLQFLQFYPLYKKLRKNLTFSE